MANKKALPSTKRPEYDVLVAVLREARIAAGLSQLELARQLGQAEAYVRKIENADRRIDVLEFYLLAKTLKLNPTDLFTRFADQLK